MIHDRTSRVTSAVEDAVQHLTFRLGREDYAIDIRHVQELKGYVTITPVPNAPAHIKGVMNLRGAILPVVDLRDRFGMPMVSYDKFTVIVVVQVLGKLCGLVVDAVTDVVYRRSPYNQRPSRTTRNSADSIYRNGGKRSTLRLVRSGTAYTGSITMGVQRS